MKKEKAEECPRCGDLMNREPVFSMHGQFSKMPGWWFCYGCCYVSDGTDEVEKDDSKTKT